MRRFLFSFSLLISLLFPVSIVSIGGHFQTKTQQKVTTVYITKMGEKYHKSGCRYLSRSQIKTTKRKAVKNGYSACKVCRP